jgi:hypothetical protein
MAKWWSNRFSKALSEYTTDYSLKDDPDSPLTLVDDKSQTQAEDKPQLGPVKKSWARRFNPFLSDKLPPIPESDAGPVPEINANWLSRLTWAWISPLMMVCAIRMMSN